MKIAKIFAIAAVVIAAFACKEPSSYEKMVSEVKNDKEVKALEVSVAKKDSASYLLGVNCGLFLLKEGHGLIDEASEINMDELMKGIEDALSAGQPDPLPSKDTTWAKKFKINPNEMSRICNEYYCGYFAYKAKFNEVLEQKYLGANKSKSGVKETATGLQYVLHTEGEGDIVGENDTLTVKYVGTFVDGTEFDSCDSLVFSLSKSVDDRKRPDIDGWAEGIRLMNNGAKATLYIPAKLAYGEKGRHGIEPNATLIFDVEVLDVKKYQEPMATEVAAE